MQTVFDQILAQVEQPSLPHVDGVDARKAQDDKAFIESDVLAFLIAQVEAMRASHFRARVISQDLGVANHTLEWHPYAVGEMPARATARLEISSIGDKSARFIAHLSFTNDKGQETETFLSSRYLDRALLERWFATFVDLCLTARMSRSPA